MLNSNEIKDLQTRIAQQSDDHAFGQLYMAFYHNLQEFAFSIIKNRELSEEIVSDVFIKIWQGRENLARVDNLKLYMYAGIKNTSLNYLKRHFRRDTVSLDEMALNLPAATYTPEHLMITNEAVKKIEFAIQNLPLRCRLIFKLAKEDGLKYNEIASLLKISVNTIDNQMAIALKKISKAINFTLEKKSH